MSESLLERARTHGGRTALVTGARTLTYAQLLSASASVARRLLRAAEGEGGVGPTPPSDLRGAPVAYLCPQSWEYVAVQWGIWGAGGMAVPLSPLHPEAELAHVLEDAGPAAVVVHPDLAGRIAALAG
ncbi:MAG TPA: AMP-binding protein, partial [Longimicrobiales bacterium]|nr:AMP-binding protein [Longimicrobiales bacterium]